MTIVGLELLGSRALELQGYGYWGLVHWKSNFFSNPNSNSNSNINTNIDSNIESLGLKIFNFL